MLSSLPAPYLWLIAGMVCLALEAFGISGIGFLFAGLAAIVVAVFIELNIVETGAYIAQFAWFFGLTMVWASLLWNPMRRFKIGKNTEPAYQNIVGDTAVVIEAALEKGKRGQVRWSGTVMQAEIAEDEKTTRIEVGSHVHIHAVKGSTLIIHARHLPVDAPEAPPPTSSQE